MLPNFLVIGAMRAGTTTLYEHLRSHPQIFMPDLKEPSFFVEEYNWHRGFDWYESLFDGAEGAIAIGESSTTYSHALRFPGAVDRIADALPHARLVYLIRHPVERLMSEYHYLATYWNLDESLDERVLDHERMLSRSMYAFQIEQYLGRFERERLLVVTTEELSVDPVATVRQVVDFVGGDPSLVDADGHVANRAGDLRVESPTLTRLKQAPFAGALRRFVPRAVRSLIWRSTARPSAVDRSSMVLSDEVRYEVERRLRPDLVRLREIMGSGFDCWGLLDDHEVP